MNKYDNQEKKILKLAPEINIVATITAVIFGLFFIFAARISLTLQADDFTLTKRIINPLFPFIICILSLLVRIGIRYSTYMLGCFFMFTSIFFFSRYIHVWIEDAKRSIHTPLSPIFIGILLFLLGLFFLFGQLIFQKKLQK